MPQFFLVSGDVNVSRLDYLIAGLAIVDDGEDVLVSFICPVSLRHVRLHMGIGDCCLLSKSPKGD